MRSIPVRELARRLSAGDVSCRDVVAQAVSRLDEVAALGGVAWRDDARALAIATELDRALAASGPVGPLHGVPVSIKDWIDATPFPCAAGMPVHAERRPERDATVVARLRAAGAVVLAKSTTGPSTELHGTPRNPLAQERTPGYSSSGEAIMVATGATAFGIGSDSGGSLRFPAHCCGLVGLRATYGRTPVTGHFPRVAALGDGRTVIGPLCHRVDDARFVLPILAGPDGRDSSCPPVAPAREPAATGLRIAVHRQTLDGALRGDVAVALDTAARALAAAGCLIADDDVLDVAHAFDITRHYWGRARLPTGEVEQLLHGWDRSRLRAMRLIDRYDAILSPAAPYPAPPLGAGDDANGTTRCPPASGAGRPWWFRPAGPSRDCRSASS